MPSSHLPVCDRARRIITRLTLMLAMSTLIITSGILCATNVSAAPGDVDPTFTAGAGANSTVFAVAVQPDGKVVIGGSFTQVNGVTRTRIARLNADGTLDTTFDTSVGANNGVSAVAVQSDGKVIIGGDFTTVNNTSRLGIARLQGATTTADDILIEGFVRRASGTPLGGVRVTLRGSLQAATTTDADGHYRFSVPADGVYQVTATARGIRFSPQTLTFGSNMVNQVGDFTALTVKGRSSVRAR